MKKSLYLLLSLLSCGLLLTACPSDDTDGDGGTTDETEDGVETTDDGETSTGDVELPDDPAPEFTTPGSYSCEGCPDSTMSTDPIDAGTATTQRFSGQVTGAVGDGQFYLVTGQGVQFGTAAAPEAVQGPTRAISGVIPTDAAGNFNFTVPLYCGEQLIKCVWENETGSYVLVQQVITTDCVEPDIRLTLTWDNLGRDYELHFIKEGGRINDNATDCTWTSCINSQPDWGVEGDASDNPKKDVDNTGNFGPENIFLSNPEDGTYTIMVEHWGGGDPMSDGTLFIGAGDQSYITNVQDLVSRHVWNVGTLEWPSGVFTASGEKIDCTENWQSGCRMEIPNQTCIDET